MQKSTLTMDNKTIIILKITKKNKAYNILKQ